MKMRIFRFYRDGKGVFVLGALMSLAAICYLTEWRVALSIVGLLVSYDMIIHRKQL